MSLDSILDRIAEEARAHSEQIRKEAEARRERIVREAREKGKSEAADILKRGQEDAKVRHERMVTLANLENRKRLLAAKQKSIQTAFDSALRSLADLPDERYKGLIKTMILATATGTERVILSKRDRDRLGNGFLAEVNHALKVLNKPGSLEFSDETRDITGGFILLGERVETNVSFDAALSLIRDDLEPEVAHVLFGRDTPGEG